MLNLVPLSLKTLQISESERYLILPRDKKQPLSQNTQTGVCQCKTIHPIDFFFA